MRSPRFSPELRRALDGFRSRPRRLAVRSRLHVWRRSRVRRKLLVHHRPGRFAGVEVVSLLRLEWAAGMLLHCRCFLRIRQFFRRWWSLGHQRRTIKWRTATIPFCLVRRWRRTRNVRRVRTLVADGRLRVRARDLYIALVRRLRCIPRVRRGRVGNVLIRPHGFIRSHGLVRSRVPRRNISGGHRGLSRPIHDWRMLHNHRPFRSYRWTGWRASCRYGPRSGIDLRMRNYLGPCDLLGIDLHHVALHRLGAAKRVRINRGRRDCLIAVVNVVNVRDVGDIGDVDVTHIGNVYLLQIDITVVIPGIKWLPRSQREPCSDTPNAKAHGKSWTPDERDERRPIDRHNRYRTGKPAPPWPDLDPPPVVERSESPRCVVNPGPAPRLDPRPASITVRTPATRQPCRIPDRPILGDRGPASVAIEIVISGHIRVYILARARILIFPVALSAPLVEAVCSRNTDRTGLHRVGSRQHHGLSTPQSLIETIPGDLHLSAVHRNQCPVLVRIGVHAIAP